MLILVILSWTLLARPFLAIFPGCTDTWFGSGCRYKCRCTNNCSACIGSSCSCTQDNCDVNGECLSGTKCQFGWFGPACQYADLAINATVETLPDTGQAPKLTDGNDVTCVQDSADVQSVKLAWAQPFIFTWLRVHAHDAKMLDNISVQFTSDINQQTDCTNPRNATVKVNNLDIYCNLTFLVKQITLTGGGVKALCSVYISAGRNVGLKESPTQLGMFYNNPAENAVDGNTNSSFDAGSCAHTYPTQTAPYPYWSLVFSQTKLVTRILIYNRDTVKERLKGFVLTATSGSGVLTYKDNSTQPQDIYTVILGSIETRISNVIIEARTRDLNGYYALTLCEVEVYGETACPDGKYGRDCEKQCRCVGECLLSTGGCPSGCVAGYQGDNCNDPCRDKFFGANCKETCSSNCMGEICDRFNGTCGRCVAGKIGTFCDQETGPGSDGEQSIVGPVVGAVAAFIVGIIIGIIGVVCWRKHRYSQPAAALATSGRDKMSDSTNGIINTLSDVEVMTSVNYIPDTKPTVRGQADGVSSSLTRTMGDYYNAVPELNTSSTIAVKDLDDVTSPYDEIVLPGKD